MHTCRVLICLVFGDLYTIKIGGIKYQWKYTVSQLLLAVICKSVMCTSWLYMLIQLQVEFWYIKLPLQFTGTPVPIFHHVQYNTCIYRWEIQGTWMVIEVSVCWAVGQMSPPKIIQHEQFAMLDISINFIHACGYRWRVYPSLENKDTWAAPVTTK